MGLIVGITLVSAGVILFVMQPVLRGDWAAIESSDDEVTEVDARKQAALRGLRDAEYDYRSGKLDQTDYQILKSELARQALEAMQEEGAARTVASDGTPEDDAAEPIKGVASHHAVESLEAEIARVRRGIVQGLTCPGMWAPECREESLLHGLRWVVRRDGHPRRQLRAGLGRALSLGLAGGRTRSYIRGTACGRRRKLPTPAR